MLHITEAQDFKKLRRDAQAVTRLRYNAKFIYRDVTPKKIALQSAQQPDEISNARMTQPTAPCRNDGS
jgi:hypothetical protein